MSADTLDTIAGWAAFILTLLVFSYLLGDNFLYRLAVYILVGATAGYVAIVAVEGVILPWLLLTVFAEGGTGAGIRFLGVVPFFFSLFFLFKNLPRLAPLGNMGIAFIVGVGTGVAVVGALLGTVIPLARDAGMSLQDRNVGEGLIMALSTIGTLIYFQYLSRRDTEGRTRRILPLRIMAFIGQSVIAITFGAIYAGAVVTSLTVFSGVVSDQIEFLFR